MDLAAGELGEAEADRPPENSVLVKLTSPPENSAPVKLTVPPENSALVS